MAAIAATLTGRILIQIGDSDPVEVGTVDIPIHVSTAPTPVTRDNVGTTEPHERLTRSVTVPPGYRG